MSFGEGNLHEQVKQLKAELEAERAKKRVEYVVDGKCESCTERRGYYMDIADLERVNSEYMDANHAQGMQIIEQGKRIAELESLVRDMWAAYSAKAESSFHPVWEVDGGLMERMKALGLTEVD